VSDHRRFTIAAGNFACSAPSFRFGRSSGWSSPFSDCCSWRRASPPGRNRRPPWHGAERRRARPVSQQFFKSLQALRLERGNALTALKAAAPAESTMIADIANSRQIVEDGYAGGLKLLDGIDAPGLAAAVAQLKSAHEAVAALRPKLDAALRQKSAERDRRPDQGMAGGDPDLSRPARRRQPPCSRNR